VGFSPPFFEGSSGQYRIELAQLIAIIFLFALLRRAPLAAVDEDGEAKVPHVSVFRDQHITVKKNSHQTHDDKTDNSKSNTKDNAHMTIISILVAILIPRCHFSMRGVRSKDNS
jgi:hypothetical protein